LTFIDVFPDLNQVLKDVKDPTEEAAYYSLDLSISKSKILERFFDTGNIKFEFATKYAANISDAYKIPDWIADIKKMY
jgi:hypothetical protein